MSKGRNLEKINNKTMLFKNVSMTGSGMLALVLGTILSWLGVNADSSQLAGWVDSIISVVGLAMLIIGQLRRKDLKLGLIRKY